MPVPTRRHRVYRSFLYLYPKAFRQDYTEQMIQTLDDMLEDCNGRAEKTAILLRVSIELPLTVLKEIITSKEDSSMDKLTRVSNKALLIGVSSAAGLIIVLLGVLLHTKVITSVASVIYHDKLADQLTMQKQVLGDPFQQFAITNIATNNDCVSESSPGISITVSCNAGETGHKQLGTSDTDKQRTIQTAKTVEAALLRQGYRAGSNGVTLSGLLTDIYAGKDYSPDAFYQKQVGRYTCSLDTFVAYANPAPAAITSSLTCYRNMQLFGSKLATDQSNKADVITPQTVAEAQAKAPKMKQNCLADANITNLFKPGETDALSSTLLAELTDVPAGTNANINLATFNDNTVTGSITYPQKYGRYNFVATKSITQNHTNEVWTITSYAACK